MKFIMTDAKCMNKIVNLFQKKSLSDNTSLGLPASITHLPIWIIIIGIVLALLISISGFMNIYFLNISHQEIEKINTLTSLALSTQIEFEKQFTMLHYILLEKDQLQYQTYFHKFSYQYTIVQNQLFNLKLLLKDFPNIHNKMNDIQKYHKDLTELLIDELFQYKDNLTTVDDVYSIIKGKDIIAIESLNNIISEINNINYEIAMKTKKKYFILSIVSISLISIVTLSLVIAILYITKLEKKFIFSIGKQLSSYLPIQLVQLILRQEKQDVVPIQKKFITVCFTDIEGFTKLTDAIEPEIVAEILNDYLSEMTVVAHKYNGTVDKFLGDGIMILFGAPNSMPTAIQIENAMTMAVEMQTIFKMLNDKWKIKINNNILHLRIGIHCGMTTVGSFGPPERLSFTAIGKIVNIAFRLQQLCNSDGILISEDVKNIMPQIPVNEGIALNVKGIDKPLEVYSIQSN